MIAKKKNALCAPNAPTWKGVLRAKHGCLPTCLAWFHSRQALHKGPRDRVDRPKSTCKSLWWHLWKRFGAPQLRLLGATTQSLLRWGGWGTRSMLKIHAHPPSNWTFHKGGPLPMAKINQRLEVSFLERPGTMLQFCLPWLRVDIALAKEKQRSS